MKQKLQSLLHTTGVFSYYYCSESGTAAEYSERNLHHGRFGISDQHSQRGTGYPDRPGRDDEKRRRTAADPDDRQSRLG